MIDENQDGNHGENKTSTRYAALTRFAPVPRLCNRHDGWTPERQRGFIAALADTGSVKSAAKAVAMATEGAYQLRRHPAAGEFRKAWEAALRFGVQRLEDVAMERALYGVDVPVYHFGQVVGTRRHYNDRLLMFLLRNRLAKRFAADSWHGGDAVSRGKLERLRVQWIAEHEEEQRRNAPSRASVRASLDRKVAEMKAMILARVASRPAHIQEAYAHYERLLAEWEEQEDREHDDDPLLTAPTDPSPRRAITALYDDSPGETP